MAEQTQAPQPAVPAPVDDEDDMFAVDVDEPESNSAAVVKEEGKEEAKVAGAEGGTEEAADGSKKKGKKRKKKRLGWVTEPNKFLYLDVFSGGKRIKQIALGAKSRYVIGRDKECGKDGILMMHPSISRKHAAICHGVPPDTPDAASGCATLLDLKAGNGTFYSKRYPCRGESKAKLASGTGLVLKEGMCFRFGESSRSFVVRGMAGATATKNNNPNFRKERDARDIALSRDLALDDDMRKKARKVGPTYKNPFKTEAHRENKTNLMLPTLSVSAPKLGVGGTTFSFHNRKKDELDKIKYEHEHLHRKRVLELKAKEKKSLA